MSSSGENKRDKLGEKDKDKGAPGTGGGDKKESKQGTNKTTTTTTPSKTTPSKTTPSKSGSTPSKDGLIRQLLQSAKPTPMTPGQTTTSSSPPCSSPLNGSPRVPCSSLPTTPLPPSAFNPRPRFTSPDSALGEDDSKSNNYLHQIAGREREIGLVLLDHPYAKPWNWKPDIGHPQRQTKSIFVSRSLLRATQATGTRRPYDERVDVVAKESTAKRPYDLIKAVRNMEECDRHANFLNPDAKSLEENEEWEEQISKESWTPPQHRFFKRILNILLADRLCRLSQSGVANEPIHRRVSADKTAKRLRQILASVSWDSKLTQWLHITMCEVLPKELLSSYAEALQTLRSKIPSLVDKIVAGKTYNERYNRISKEGIRILLKKRWDPVRASLSEQKLKKLAGNPVIILTPSGPVEKFPAAVNSRAKLWTTMLSQLGKLVSIAPPKLSANSEVGTSINAYMHSIVTSVLGKVKDAKRQERAVILVGWGFGAAINSQVASMESVTACVALGWPMYTLDGIRGDSDDPILDVKTAMLFVIGELASQCRSDDVEDMRERMRADTGLLIVGGADDLLRVSKHKKKAEGLTQGMVDRCIMDEIRDFLHGVLTSPPPNFSVPPYAHLEHLQSPLSGNKKTPVRRKRLNPDGTPVVPKRRSNKGSPAKRTKATPTPSSGAPTPTSASSSPAMTPTPAGVMTNPPSTLPTLPTTPIKSVSSDEVSKARKLLDMGSVPPNPAFQPADKLTAQIMASSPLLSSALTSPTKVTTQSTTKLPSPTATFTDTRPRMAHPTTIVKQTTLPPPVPLPTVPVQIRPTGATPQQSQQPRMPKPTIMISAGAGQNTPGTPRGTIIHSSPMAKTTTVPARFATAGPSTAVVKKGVSGNKDNLYVIALPPEQLKSLENAAASASSSGGLVQYRGGQMVTLISGGDKLKMKASESPSIASSASSTPPETPGTERRNMAEILASLSGLTPEPPTKTAGETPEQASPQGIIVKPTTTATSTPTTATVVNLVSATPVSASPSVSSNKPSPTILSSASAGGRVVRVLQASSGATSTSRPSAVSVTPTTTSSTTTMRSRKQVFVTNVGGGEGDKSDSGGGGEGSEAVGDSSVVKEDDSSGSGKIVVPASEQPYEQDILEEDVNDDAEYVPYAKKSKIKRPSGGGEKGKALRNRSGSGGSKK